MADQDPDNLINEDSINNAKKLSNDVEDIRSALFDAHDYARDMAKELRQSSSSINKMFTDTTKINYALDDYQAVLSRIGNTYISQGSIEKKIIQNSDIRIRAEKSILEITKKIADKEQELDTLNGKTSKKAKVQIENITNQLTPLKAILETINKQIASLDATDKGYKDVLKDLDKYNDKAHDATINALALKRILSSIASIPIIGPLLDWQRISDKIFGEGGSNAKGIAELKKQVKDLLNNTLVRGLIGLYALEKIYDLFKGYVKVLAEVDKGVTSLSNNIGMSKAAGDELYDTFGDISWDTIWGSKGLIAGLDSSFMSIRNMVNASNELQDSLGTNTLMTEDRIESEILLTKQMKMSNEEAAGFQRLSAISGKTVSGILQTTIKQNTAGLSYKKILKEVSEVSAELSMRLGNDPEKIAKAVVQANKLGLSLESTRKISDSLLNFESSIEGELEAELLLGKRFNFEKARELALMGKSSEAAADLLGQIGGINELEKMNVIQRERVANAIGLSADELSKAAIQEQVLKQLNLENVDALKERVKILQQHNDYTGIAALEQEAAKVRGGDILVQDIAKASAADKYAQTMEKLEDILANILAHSTALKVAFVALAAVAAGIAASMVAAAVASIIATGGVSALTAGIGIGALTLAAGGAAMYAVSDSVISPSGQVMISTPKGGIIPDKNDSIITTTNPQGLLNGGNNNDGMASVAQEIKNLHQTISRGGNVYIDSVRSGMAYGMSYNSYA